MDSSDRRTGFGTISSIPDPTLSLRVNAHMNAHMRRKRQRRRRRKRRRRQRGSMGRRRSSPASQQPCPALQDQC
jgi:anti-sigma factor RsiW